MELATVFPNSLTFHGHKLLWVRFEFTYIANFSCQSVVSAYTVKIKICPADLQPLRCRWPQKLSNTQSRNMLWNYLGGLRKMKIYGRPLSVVLIPWTCVLQPSWSCLARLGHSSAGLLKQSRQFGFTKWCVFSYVMCDVLELVPPFCFCSVVCSVTLYSSFVLLLCPVCAFSTPRIQQGYPKKYKGITQDHARPSQLHYPSNSTIY